MPTPRIDAEFSATTRVPVRIREPARKLYAGLVAKPQR
jgi:hypothetical protein